MPNRLLPLKCATNNQVMATEGCGGGEGNKGPGHKSLAAVPYSSVDPYTPNLISKPVALEWMLIGFKCECLSNVR